MVTDKAYNVTEFINNLQHNITDNDELLLSYNLFSYLIDLILYTDLKHNSDIDIDELINIIIDEYHDYNFMSLINKYDMNDEYDKLVNDVLM